LASSDEIRPKVGFAIILIGKNAIGAAIAERRAEGDMRVQLAMTKRALPVAAPAPNTITLPKTATDAELKMILGSILLALGLILLAFNRRQMSPADAG
jgi:Ca-activated chloride channel family protein